MNQPRWRPRTVGPFGQPTPLDPDAAAEPQRPPPLESFEDPMWKPPTEQVQLVEVARDTADPASAPVEPVGPQDRDLRDEPGDRHETEDRDEPAEGIPSGRRASSAAEAPAGMLKDNVMVATGTLLSRITGLARTALLFATLAPVLRDAYVLANNTPNIIYELILGGVLTATLVPLFTEFFTKGDDDSTSVVVSAAIVALVALTIMALVATPALMALYASNTPPGVDRGEFLSVGVRLALLFAPQVFFYGAMAVGSALLNSRRRFFAAAWAPVLNNVIVIAVLVAVARIGDRPEIDQVQSNTGLMLLLGLGTTAGIVTMAVALFPALRRAGVHIRFTWRLRHPAVKRALALSGWTIGYVIANQIAGQIINVLTEPGSSGTANYQLAFQFFQLPHGLLAVSLMTTFQPELARAFSLDDDVVFADRLQFALRLLALAVVPAVVIYVAVPLATLVGAAQTSPDADLIRLGSSFLRLGDVAEVARILTAFAGGLVGFSLYLFVLRAFYSRGDTRTPFFLNCIKAALNVVFALVLVGRFGVVGLALAYGAAYSVAAVLSAMVLLRRLAHFDLRGLLSSYARIGAAAAGAAVAIVAVGLPFRSQHGSPLVVGMALAGVAGLVAYAVLVTVLRVPGVHDVAGRLPLMRRLVR